MVFPMELDDKLARLLKAGWQFRFEQFDLGVEEAYAPVELPVSTVMAVVAVAPHLDGKPVSRITFPCSADSTLAQLALVVQVLPDPGESKL